MTEKGVEKPMAAGSLGLFVADLFSLSIYSNFIWSILNLVLSKGMRFAGILLCIRQMGMLTWGQVTSTLVFVTFLGFLVDQGLSGSPQVFHVHDRSRDMPLLLKISLYRFAMAVGLNGLLHAAGAVFPASVNPLILIYAIVLIPRALNIDWLFHRREQYHLTMVIGSFRTLLFFALVVMLVDNTSTAKVVIAIEILAEAGGILFSYLLLKGVGGGVGRFSGVPLAGLLIFSAPILLTQILDMIPGFVEIMFLKLHCGYEVIGQYDIGGKIGLLYFFLGASLIQIILPKLARLHASGDAARMGEILSSSSKLLLLLTTLLIIPSFYFSREILGFLFKKDFPLTVFVFQWIPVWVYISCMTMLNTATLLAVGKRREYLRGAFLSCAVNVAGNWLLIGAFSGYGVVFARILSEAAFFAYSYSRLPRDLRGSFSRDTGVQIGNLLLLVAIFQVSSWTHQRALCMALSLAACLAIVYRQKTLSRRTLAVLKKN